MGQEALLVSVAFDLFYRQGVHAVSVNRVIEESGVAKKTLYTYFSSKEELVAATLDYRGLQLMSWIEQRFEHRAIAEEAIPAFFNALHNWINGEDPDLGPFHGSYFMNVCAEFGELDHPIHQQCAKYKSLLAQQVGEHIEPMYSGSLAGNTLSRAITTLVDGAIVQAHVSGDLKAALQARTTAEELMSTRWRPDGSHRGHTNEAGLT